MPFKVVFHNGDQIFQKKNVAASHEVPAAISNVIEGIEDFSDGDSITILAMTDTDVANEIFWDEFRTLVEGGK